MSDKLKQNERLVEKLFEILYGAGDNIELLDELVAEDYVQHNHSAGQGLQDLKRYFKRIIPLPYRNEPRDVALFADGDFVIRKEVRAHKYSGVLIDIFRVKDGKLQEHWDAYRPDPGTERMPGF
ncbi:nuclear transport factor 2 family protein [Georgenia sp. EYE_87]|uniref:nuclear transport factor 2 family protein n=1 Tax=Georgenia sp. EYE_87 TaxID=2853448 RepID=UPI0020056B27|nr:nuclear transport factor 2 family protein [Georgenia sp. EYE_87]